MRNTTRVASLLLWAAMVVSARGDVAILYNWTFDGANGQTTNLPEGVAGNTGTTIGAGGITTTGAPVGSGAFHRTSGGNNDLISLSTNFAPPTTSFTIGAWIKTTQANYPNILSWTSTGDEFAQEFRLVNGQLQANQFLKYSYNQSVTSSGPAVNDDQWHFVAVTRQYGGGTSLFADTAFQVTDSMAITASRLTGYTAHLSGSSFFDLPYSFNGTLDDISLWDGRLSEAQLKSVRNLGLSDLDYNAQDAATLFGVYDTGTQAAIDGRTWYKTTGLTGDPGDVVAMDGANFGVVLDGSGGGVSTVPEPGAIVLLGTGASMLLAGLVYRRRRQRQAAVEQESL